VYTVAQCDAFSEQVVKLAQADDRIVAGAVVGSLAVGAGDRFSDIDLTFAVAGAVPIVQHDWTRMLVEQFDAGRCATTGSLSRVCAKGSW
jgi:hypothetical protein